jgi:hypothetical protein
MGDSTMISAALKNEIKNAIIKSLEKNNSISECIGEYLQANQTIDSDFLAQEIIEDFNIDSICDEVEKILVDRALTFMVYPSIGEDEEGLGRRVSSEYMCPTCYRPHGHWVGKNKVSVDPQILQNGKTIIVAE